MNRQGQLHTIVAYTTYPWDHALTNLRFVRPLQKAGVQVLRGNKYSNVDIEKIALGDAVLIQREFPNNLEAYEQIIQQARAKNKPIIYEIDDLLLELPEEHPDRSIDYYTPALFSMLRAIIEADMVTTSTPYLQDYLRPFNPHTYLLPNYLDDDVWSFPEPVHKTDPFPVTVGYMGSDTHLPDLVHIVPVFATLLERYGDKITLRFWGGEPPASICTHPQVEWIPMTIPNYAEFAAFFSQQNCDICVAPLIDSFFNHCKSPIKYLEYSALGIPGVYSQVRSYESVIRQGINGFLAATIPEWEHHLTQLIENPGLRYEVGYSAQQDIQMHWLLSQNAHQWTTAYQEALRLASDAPDRAAKNEYTDIFIRVASQVRDWQLKLSHQITQKDQEITALQAQVAEQAEIQGEITSSTAWKFVQAVWKLRVALLPPGSARERLAKQVTGRRSGEEQ